MGVGWEEAFSNQQSALSQNKNFTAKDAKCAKEGKRVHIYGVDLSKKCKSGVGQ